MVRHKVRTRILLFKNLEEENPKGKKAELDSYF